MLYYGGDGALEEDAQRSYACLIPGTSRPGWMEVWASGLLEDVPVHDSVLEADDL